MVALGGKKGKTSISACIPCPVQKNKKQSTCAKNKRKKWPGGDPCPNTSSLAAAAIKNKEQLTCAKKWFPGW